MFVFVAGLRSSLGRMPRKSDSRIRLMPRWPRSPRGGPDRRWWAHSHAEMLRQIAPATHARDARAFDLAVPRLVEEEHADAGIRQRFGDDDVVLAEGIEGELFRQTSLVLSRTGGVVSAARI